MQIISVGALLCSFPSWCQEPTQGSTWSKDSYREHLRDASADRATTPSTSPRDSRESYKERLRRLAGGEETSGALCEGSQAPAGAAAPEIPQATAPSPSSIPTAHEVRAESSPVERVSSPANTVSTDGGPAEQSRPGSCRDAYCHQLRRVADGKDLPIKRPELNPNGPLTTERNFIKNLAFDQVHIWESPFKMRDSDATWAVPFGIVTGGLIATDRDLSKQLAKPSRLAASKTISDYGLYGFIGAGAGFYGLGLMTHDDHKRETGLLAGEALINASLVAEALKLSLGRQRPFEGDHFGHIRKGGSSFPSGHAIDSWALATVFAHEYPNSFMQIAAYGLAATVAATRVTAGQHFPTDVVVGGTLGYLIGRKTYHDHHNPELAGSEYGTFVHDRRRDADHAGSSYVPLESWVYPVIDRLAGLGIVHSQFDSERPFTRLECARIAAEGVDRIESDDVSSDIRSMVESLQQEFSRESEVWAGDSDNRSAEVESVYTRLTEISGPVLRDSFHFGQTIYNDYGRPYARGFNNVTGVSARSTAGPMVFYFRGEYQHAGDNPIYSPQLLAQLNTADHGPTQSGPQFPGQDRFQVLDAYIGLNFGNNQLTLGQQSLWWGPGTGGAFMLTNNAEPLKMIRLSRTTPATLPGPFSLLGPLRYEAFLGQTDGYHYLQVDGVLLGPHLRTQPFIQGQRFSFKPTENFEFGFSRTGVFGGDGNPLTAKYLFRATFSAGSQNLHDPGDRRSGVDITYRVPKLRDWLTFYLDEFSEDEISPLFAPRRSAMHPGIYLAKLPRLRRVDLRVEGVYTDPPSFRFQGFFYDNVEFKNGYTKNGNLLGSWIGREGRGIYAVSRIWLSPINTVELGYRGATVDREFLEGGHYTDFSLRSNFQLHRDWSVSAGVQLENWRFPALASGLQRNVSSSLQLSYSPSRREH